LLLVILVPAWWAAFVGSMRVVAVITEPPRVRKILRHLIKVGKAPPGLQQRFGDVRGRDQEALFGRVRLLGAAHHHPRRRARRTGRLRLPRRASVGKAAPEQAADLDRIIAEGEKHKKKLGFIRSNWG
jgi:hypothetical protein